MAILAANGTVVTIEEAKIILDFMYQFAKLSIDQQINKDKRWGGKRRKKDIE